jgi:hypothetical protein
MLDNQLITEKLDEIKSILLDDRKLSEIVLKLNDILDKINITSFENEVNENSIVLEKINLFESNQIKLNQNYEKLIGKPLGLLEIIQKAISDNIDLKKDLNSIQNAINKIREFEKNKISTLIQENKSLIEDIKKLTSNLQDNQELAESNKFLINQLHEIKNILSKLSITNPQNDILKDIKSKKEEEEEEEDDLKNNDDFNKIEDKLKYDDDFWEDSVIENTKIEDPEIEEVEETSVNKTINIDLNQIKTQKPIKRIQFDEDYLNLE